MAKGLEIERKYLIRSVNLATLRKYAEGNIVESDIEQVYLIADEGERRIRKKVTDGVKRFYYTEKKPINGMTREEKEEEVTEEMYNIYLTEADENLYPIIKKRYTFEVRGQVFELDVYPFSCSRAILEIELPSEDTPVEIPKFISVVKEVTNDKAYKNHQLAKTQSLG